MKFQILDLMNKHTYFAFIRYLLPIFSVSVLPVLFTGELWHEVWTGLRPGAWDGSGHFALARLYSQTIFPDTFGWTHAYLNGTPVPNFYPPLFYWIVALLHRSHIFSFVDAFKVVLILPALLLPAAIWALSWKVSGGDHKVATCAALAAIPLLVDYRFTNNTGLLGLSYYGTFIVGLYSQTLGFVLLLAWYILYSSKRPQPWHSALSTVLLATAVLANFFSAVTATLFIGTILYQDLKNLRAASDLDCWKRARQVLMVHLISPLLAFSLTLFWVGPMLVTYDYFVTRPQSIPFSDLVPTVILVWYAFALIGVFIWLNKPTSVMGPYLMTCLLLEVAVFIAPTISPRWFPLYPQRFASTLNFLLAVPVGQTLAFAFQVLRTDFIAFARWYKSTSNDVLLGYAGNTKMYVVRFVRSALMLLVVLFAASWVTPVSYKTAFYQVSEVEPIDSVLRFAEHHKDGRYLVEIPYFSDAEAAFQWRALNSYLGMQNNEALSFFFREASPNVIFLSPLVNALSVQSDSFGISSVLADDTDFVQQPLEYHLERARFMGTRYLIVYSARLRSRLERMENVIARHDFGRWKIYELYNEQEIPQVRALFYQPALLVSNLSLKARRRTEYDFIRFAEEQFADNWFDVLLAHAPETKIDRLRIHDGFGALIIDTYESDNENRAFEVLREFARDRLLILIASDTTLFRRINSSISDFPKAKIIEREVEPEGEWLTSNEPTTSYQGSAARKAWKMIKHLLDSQKIPVANSAPIRLSSNTTHNSIGINFGPKLSAHIPVLVSTTYHPNWVREDDEAVYAATPFFMVTFVHRQANLVYKRSLLDWLWLAASASVLLIIIGIIVRQILQHLPLSRHGQKLSENKIYNESPLT